MFRIFSSTSGGFATLMLTDRRFVLDAGAPAYIFTIIRSASSLRKVEDFFRNHGEESR
jgi:hypothetical protein